MLRKVESSCAAFAAFWIQRLLNELHIAASLQPAVTISSQYTEHEPSKKFL